MNTDWRRNFRHSFLFWHNASSWKELLTNYKKPSTHSNNQERLVNAGFSPAYIYWHSHPPFTIHWSNVPLAQW